jgi:hypothetical protein
MSNNRFSSEKGVALTFEGFSVVNIITIVVTVRRDTPLDVFTP